MSKKDFFPQVSRLIESGFTICQALDQLEIDSRKFYKSITKEQRLELEHMRASNRGMIHRGYMTVETKDLHEFFTNEDYAF